MKISLYGRDSDYALRVAEKALLGVCGGVRDSAASLLTLAGATPAEKVTALAKLDAEHAAFIAEALAAIAHGLAIDETLTRAMGDP